MSRDNSLGPIGAPVPPGQQPQQGQPRPHRYKVYLRIPGQDISKPIMELQPLSIDKAACAALAQFYDNGSIRELRIVKNDSGLVVPG